MGSNLAYSNLGLDDSEIDQFRSQTLRSLKEFHSYLEKAIAQLRKKDYTYDIVVDRVEARILWTKGQAHSIDPTKLFLDIKGRQPLVVGNYDAEKGRLVLGNLPPGRDHIFQLTDVGFVPLEIAVRVLVSSVVPIVDDEELEDQALDFLFYQADQLSGANDGERVRVLESDRKRGTLVLSGQPGSARVRAKEDINVILQQIKAVERLAMGPAEHHKPLLRLLLKGERVRWEEVTPLHPERYHVLTKDEIEGCDEQRRFVDLALGTPDLAILDGPPGSGKTTTLIELVIQLIKQGKRVMVVASTHVAVDNILERLSEGEEGKTLIDQFGIVPLRIGKESVVSERIAKYCLSNVVETQRELIRSSLAKVKNRTPAQEDWYSALNQGGDSWPLLSKMCFDMANLVCGTTIGILRSPSIQGSTASTPPFDYLILDEASKTTFPEFLVPALYARRWVLSGDPRQLAPYVEEANIMENLRVLGQQAGMTEATKRVCLMGLETVRASNQSRSTPMLDTKLVVLEDGSEKLRLLQVQFKDLEAVLERKNQVGPKDRKRYLAAAVVDGRPEDHMELARMVSSALIFTSVSQEEWVAQALPLGTEVVREAGPGPAGTSRRDETSWEEQIAWRLGRMYEVRDQDRKFNDYQSDIDMLLPYCLDRNGAPNGNGGYQPQPSELIGQGISAIRRIALPSVLDLLMDGFETCRARPDLDIALYRGLPKPVLEERKVLLTYQHRMHPDISRFPRHQFYAGKALNDGRWMDGWRSWSYTAPDAHRVIMYNVVPKKEDVAGDRANFNLAEVAAIKAELANFLRWAKDHPKKGKDKLWSIALLTFYKGQEKQLATMLQGEFKVQGRRYFDLSDSNVELQVCNVDRFQGHEADMVLLSFVRSWAHGRGIGFLDNANRLNVALTRAKYYLVVFADARYFSRSGTPVLRELVEQLPANINYRSQN